MPSASDLAPNFDLPALTAGVRKRFRLADRTSQNLLIAFYPRNWDPVSAEQMAAYQVERPRLLAHSTDIVGVCVDSIMNTTVWEREIGPLDFTLCSDFWPHGEVSRAYGVLNADGASERALFIIDRAGVIRFSRSYRLEEVPDAREALQVLASLHEAA